MQEERRLFYVALTRARERLTLTTVVHKRSKPSVFLDDILSAPQLARQTCEQLTPAAAGLQRPPRRRARERLRRSSPRRAAAAARLFAHRRVGLSVPAAGVRAAATERLGHGFLPKLPAEISVRRRSGAFPAGPRAATTFGNVMHTTIKQFIEALRKGQRPPFEEVETIFRREWTSAGFEDNYQEECYQRDGIEQLRAFYASCLEAPPDVGRAGKALHAGARKQRADHRAHGPDQPSGAKGEVEIVDYKTGKPKTDAQARKDLQLGIYALAAREDAGTRAGAAGLLQPAKQRVRRGNTRGEAAAGSERRDPGSGRRHSRPRISRDPRLSLQDLRVPLSLSRRWSRNVREWRRRNPKRCPSRRWPPRQSSLDKAGKSVQNKAGRP